MSAVDGEPVTDDAALVRALTPTVELAIRQSVRRDPQPLADAIFPVIGPAIRKAIASAIGGLIESMNQAADLAFSLDAVRWRIEAWRSGRSFGEVVIAHRLRYSVEQLFLIQRDSGLLLAHVARTDSIAPDVVAGMLTAIQEFVRESFNLERTESLHTLQAGEVTVLIEQGPEAVLAAVIRGYAPRAAAVRLAELIGALHSDFGDSLQLADGDPRTSIGLELRLRDGLVTELTRTRRSRLLPLATVAAVLIVGALIVSLRNLALRGRWRSYVEQLAITPGIVVVDNGRRDGRWFISGLRDPLARDPQTLLDSLGIARSGVEAHWRPYLALDPEFALIRARRALAPPASVTLSATDSGIKASGLASHDWTLQAKRVSTLLGLSLDTRVLRDADVDAVEREARDITNMRIQFPTGSDRPTAEGQRVADEMLGRIRRLVDAARAVGSTVDVVAVGRTDQSGTEARNATLATARSTYLRRMIGSLGVASPSVAQQAVVADSQRTASVLIEVRRGTP